uniref:PDZ domain-containing protein n=1 Tax=Steinernema glaseri TaxID=37863 RepID=A0A1I7Z4X2_9BILA
MSRLSIIDLADHAGILSLNPSDLVFEASQLGIQYYDFTLSAASTSDHGYQLYLVKFDSHTNVEWLETARVGPEIVKSNGIPDNDLSMMTLGILLWKHKVARSRVLCLVRSMDADSMPPPRADHLRTPQLESQPEQPVQESSRRYAPPSDDVPDEEHGGSTPGASHTGNSVPPRA